jgi:hypothetical protein
LLLARVNACLILAWYCDELLEYEKEGFGRSSPAVEQVEGLERGIPWPNSSNLFSRTHSDSLHSFTESASLGLTLSHSLSLPLSPPLFPRVLLSDACCSCLVTITRSLCNTRNSAAWTWTIVIATRYPFAKQDSHAITPISSHHHCLLPCSTSASASPSTSSIDIHITLPAGRAPHSILVLRCPSF